MNFFRINGRSLSRINQLKIDLEKDLQILTERNLEEVFGLTFVCSELQLQGLRIDTLAFNQETSSFTIVEYKRDKSFSVIDQGYAYLALLLNNKADFTLEYNERVKKSLRKDQIDWSQSKVIFVANSFTTYQVNAINFQDLPIELWEAKKFDHNLLSYNQIMAKNAVESVRTITKESTDKGVKQISKEVRTYTPESLFKNDWTESKELFEELRIRIFELDSRFEEAPTKYYIGYKLNKLKLFDLNVYKLGIAINFMRSQPQNFNDPEGRLKYMDNSIKYYNQHVTGILLEHGVYTDIDYAMFLIKQVYRRFVK